MKIQTTLSADYLQTKITQSGPWFYQFEFDNGVRTDPLPDGNVQRIHESRAQCIFPFLDRHFGGRWNEISCLDVACHEGWFAFQLAQRGARTVRGIDIRPERIDRANLVRAAGGFANTTFEVRDLLTLDPARDGTFNLTLFLGIFYHLEDPVRGFRAVRALTRELCVVEGQVARFRGNITTAWGNKDELRSGPPCVVVDADPQHARNGDTICLVPSLEALQRIVRAAGFTRTELLPPTSSLHEQYVNLDRAILFAFV